MTKSESHPEHGMTDVERGYYVYLHTDKVTGVPFYVGKGKGKADPCRVLELRGRGLNNNEIAAAMSASTRTVVRMVKRAGISRSGGSVNCRCSRKWPKPRFLARMESGGGTGMCVIALDPLPGGRNTTYRINRARDASRATRLLGRSSRYDQT